MLPALAGRRTAPDDLALQVVDRPARRAVASRSRSARSARGRPADSGRRRPRRGRARPALAGDRLRFDRPDRGGTDRRRVRTRPRSPARRPAAGGRRRARPGRRSARRSSGGPTRPPAVARTRLARPPSRGASASPAGPPSPKRNGVPATGRARRRRARRGGRRRSRRPARCRDRRRGRPRPADRRSGRPPAGGTGFVRSAGNPAARTPSDVPGVEAPRGGHHEVEPAIAVQIGHRRLADQRRCRGPASRRDPGAVRPSIRQLPCRPLGTEDEEAVVQRLRGITATCGRHEAAAPGTAPAPKPAAIQLQALPAGHLAPAGPPDGPASCTTQRRDQQRLLARAQQRSAARRRPGRRGPGGGPRPGRRSPAAARRRPAGAPAAGRRAGVADGDRPDDLQLAPRPRGGPAPFAVVAAEHQGRVAVHEGDRPPAAGRRRRAARGPRRPADPHGADRPARRTRSRARPAPLIALGADSSRPADGGRRRRPAASGSDVSRASGAGASGVPPIGRSTGQPACSGSTTVAQRHDRPVRLAVVVDVPQPQARPGAVVGAAAGHAGALGEERRCSRPGFQGANGSRALPYQPST
jgi:hypothetical protein